MAASARWFGLVRGTSLQVLRLRCPGLGLGLGPPAQKPTTALLPRLRLRFLSTCKILSLTPVHASILHDYDCRIPNNIVWSVNTGSVCLCRTFVGMSGTRLRKTVFNEEKQKPGSEPDENLLKSDKVMKLNLNSTRLDAVLKAGLQISKNKIEKIFFADRIRVNGERPKKKSQTMREGDEIDILHKPNEVNPDFIDVSRIEILQLGEEVEEDDEDMIEVKGGDDDEDYRIPAVLKRYKRLTVENYKQKWKGPVE